MQQLFGHTPALEASWDLRTKYLIMTESIEAYNYTPAYRPPNWTYVGFPKSKEGSGAQLNVVPELRDTSSRLSGPKLKQ